MARVDGLGTIILSAVEAIGRLPHYYRQAYSNWARPHGALHGRPPITCLAAPTISWQFKAGEHPSRVEVHAARRYRRVAVSWSTAGLSPAASPAWDSVVTPTTSS